jgi:Putative Ig domain
VALFDFVRVRRSVTHFGLWRTWLILSLFSWTAAGQGADSPSVLDVQDAWGRSLKQTGITLVDWDGYLANPAVRLAIQTPSDATFPATVRLSANGARLHFDDLGAGSTVGPAGPAKTIQVQDQKSQAVAYLAIFPDRDGEDEDYVLTVTFTDAKKRQQSLRVPIHVIDQDRDPPKPSPFKITVDYSQDKTGFFNDSRARAIIQQAADDWAYFFEDIHLDPVPANAEATLIWDADGFVSNTTVRNRSAYTGFLLYAYGIKGPELRSGGEGSRRGGFHTSKGTQLPLKRSGGVEIEVQGNYNRRGWFYAQGDDDWWKSGNRGHEANDLYSIAHHEIGHALIFNPAYPRFAWSRLTGSVKHPQVTAYHASPLKVDSHDHLDGFYDPASRRGAFGYEYHGDMPKRRWLITKLDLLVAQAVGYKLRRTSAFEPLQARAAQVPVGTVRQPYRATITITGGVPTYHCSVESGRLPAGLVLNSFTGEISGTPREAGGFTVALLVRDSPATPGVKLPLRIEVKGTN